MIIRCEKLEKASPIVFELFDKDLITDDYMGRAVIHVNLFITYSGRTSLILKI